MENKNFKPVLWGLILLVVGTVIFFGAWSRLDYGQVTVTGEEAVRRSKTVDEPFESISISETACDIRLEPAADGVCRVEYSDNENVTHKVYVKNKCLVIEEMENRRVGYVFNLGTHDENHTLVVYLPEGEYSRLSVNSASADLSAGEGFSFSAAEINTASGSVKLGGIVSGKLSINTASGNVELSGLRLQEVEAISLSGGVWLKNIEAAREIKAETASGTVYLANIHSHSLELDSASGDIELENVVCIGEMSFETASGDVSFERCDARELEFETASGSIKGSLLSGKDFRIETLSGSIDVPKDSEGGLCSIETVSGSVKITVAK